MAKKSMKELAAYAKKRAKERHKYKIGGWSWKTGLECHAFTGKVYKECGYTDVYNRIRRKGFYKKPWADKYLGKYLAVRMSKGLLPTRLKEGDIVIRKNGVLKGYHTAIYIGDGKVAEAVKGGTRIGKLTKKFTMAFRIPEEKKKPVKKTKYKVVRKKGANIRKSPSVKSEKLGVYKHNTIFETSASKGLWVKSPKGWILTKTDKVKILEKVL